MADPFTIIGIAVNIASLIDLGFKLVSAAVTAHESIHGTTQEITTLKVLVEDIEVQNTQLQNISCHAQNLSAAEVRILKLVKECDSITTELRRALNKLVIRDNVPSRTIESGRVAIQSWWKRRDLAALKQRLFDVDNCLKQAINIILSQSQHSAVMSELRELRSEARVHEQMFRDTKSQIEGIRHDLQEFAATIASIHGLVDTTLGTMISSNLETISETSTNAQFSGEKQLHQIRQNILAFASNLQSTAATRPCVMKISSRVSEIAHRYEGTTQDNVTVKELYRIRDVILRTTSDDTKWNDASPVSGQLASGLVDLRAERNSITKKIKILRSLYFPEIKRRLSDIIDAESNTLTWLYDESLTTFSKWLDSQHGIYWINGLAGSGKSTLMKFAANNISTKLALRQWSGGLPIHQVSHYFWHHGHPMQRSQSGLFQSLLYQILRASPDLIPIACPDVDMLDFEEWEMVNLRHCLERLCRQTALSAKFCFFIDGLDEYTGDLQELIETLRMITKSSHIKMCVSSRPWPDFVEAFDKQCQSLTVQDYTLQDMEIFVKFRLANSHAFRELQIHDPSCDEIIREVAKRAQGVWLWTFLVTNDLRKAVTRKEGVATLRRILNGFPSQLEEYFQHMIRRIEPHYQKDMVQILMLVIDGAQSIPLYSFDVLDRNRLKQVDYVVKALVKTPQQEEVNKTIENWTVRIHNRCSDLLRVTKNHEETYILKYRVDFLHRTVADWLRESYVGTIQRMNNKADADFSPRLTLCCMMLLLLKRLPIRQLHTRASINELIALTDEFLCYIYELESDPQKLDETDLVKLLDTIDATNSTHFDSVPNHWTHARDLPRGTGMDRYVEGGECNFKALVIQCRLVRYVRSKLEKQDIVTGYIQPRGSKAQHPWLRKRGRPLLDYALRPRRVTPFELPVYLQREEPSVNTEMIQLLLDYGANPNEKVHLNDGMTVFALFATACYEASRGYIHSRQATVDNWYHAAEILVEHGAMMNFKTLDTDKHRSLRVDELLVEVFGLNRVERLRSLAPPDVKYSMTWVALMYLVLGLLGFSQAFLYLRYNR